VIAVLRSAPNHVAFQTIDRPACNVHIEQMQGTNTSIRWFNVSIHHSADTEAGVWMQALLRLPG
jgi:hypothetical protein